ncbi:hypothetical protein MMC25_001107 [Agyrium rufum]|nr:hypothetical protein [Agyrium rufum]
MVGEAGKTPGLFVIIDPKEHAARRRLYAPAFTSQSMLDWEDLVQQKVRLAVSQLRHRALQGPVDMLPWWTFMATDLVTELAFGASANTLENGKNSDFLEIFGKMAKFRGLRLELPYLIKPLSYLPIPFFQRLQQLPYRLEASACSFIEKNKGGDGDQTQDITVFAKALAEADASKGLTKDIIWRDAKDFIIAGSDSTSVTMTYIVWAVIKHPNVRARLEQALEKLPEDFSSKDALGIHYLHLVVQEALRLYGAAQGLLPRTVPPGGKQVGGYFLPGHTEVSTQSYTLQRDSRIFPEPFKYIPERWENPAQEMKDAFMPFGAGTRACLGRHLADMELYSATATFFRECQGARLAPNVTDEEMEFEQYFLVKPRGHGCEIVMT